MSQKTNAWMIKVMKVRHDLKPEFSKEIEIQKQTQAEMEMHEEKIKINKHNPIRKMNQRKLYQ